MTYFTGYGSIEFGAYCDICDLEFDVCADSAMNGPYETGEFFYECPECGTEDSIHHSEYFEDYGAW